MTKWASSNPTESGGKAGIALDQWRRQARYLNVGKHRIAWWEQGQGEPLILIHGFPTAAWDWQYLWRDLASRYRVIAMDLLGYGLSDKPWPYLYSIMEQADIVLALAKALQLPHFHLLTHDYGDTVAQELLARHLEAAEDEQFLQSLCLLNGGLFPEMHRPVLTQRLLLTPLGPVLTRLFRQRTLKSNLQRIFGQSHPPTDDEIEGFWELITQNQGQRVFPGLIRYIKERRRHRERWVGALQAARLPMRLINGVDDPISGAHMANHYDQLVPHPDVVRLEGVGHYPQVESPAEVLNAYEEFRARVLACAQPPGSRPDTSPN